MKIKHLLKTGLLLFSSIILGIIPVEKALSRPTLNGRCDNNGQCYVCDPNNPTNCRQVPTRLSNNALRNLAGIVQQHRRIGGNTRGIPIYLFQGDFGGVFYAAIVESTVYTLYNDRWQATIVRPAQFYSNSVIARLGFVFGPAWDDSFQYGVIEPANEQRRQETFERLEELRRLVR